MTVLYLSGPLSGRFGRGGCNDDLPGPGDEVAAVGWKGQAGPKLGSIGFLYKEIQVVAILKEVENSLKSNVLPEVILAILLELELNIKIKKN